MPSSRLILTVIKAVHSGIFLAVLSCIGWFLATGVTGRRDRTVAIAACAVALEAAVFVANDGTCPLTPLAERYGARRGSVSDIFLPDLLARTLPTWSSALLALAAAFHVRALCKERH